MLRLTPRIEMGFLWMGRIIEPFCMLSQLKLEHAPRLGYIKDSNVEVTR